MRQLPKHLLLVLGIAILIRILLLFWSVPLAINGDQRRYEDWAQTTHVHGLAATYKGGYNTTVVNNEPPGTLYIISGTYEVYILLGKMIAKLTHTAPGSLQFVNSYLLHLLMRLPSVFTDLGMGILAYLLVAKKKDDQRGVLAAGLIVLNPIIFYNSSVWGQTDSLNNFFFLLSLFLAFRKKYIFSILAYACSLYIKLSLLPLLPFYFVFLFFSSQKQWKPVVIGTLLSVMIVTLATWPISPQPVSWLMTTIPAISHGELRNVTIAAFNFWWVVTCGPITCPHRLAEISDPFLGLTFNIWGYLLFTLATLPILYLQIKKSKQLSNPPYLFLAFSLVTIAIFHLLPQMHDRYLYPFFPLFAIAIAFSKKIKSSLILYCFLAFIYMGNLIYSEYPTKFPFFIFYQIIYSNLFRWSLSLLITIVCIIIYQQSFVWLLEKNRENKTSQRPLRDTKIRNNDGV